MTCNVRTSAGVGLLLGLVSIICTGAAPQPGGEGSPPQIMDASFIAFNLQARQQVARSHLDPYFMVGQLNLFRHGERKIEFAAKPEAATVYRVLATIPLAAASLTLEAGHDTLKSDMATRVGNFVHQLAKLQDILPEISCIDQDERRKAVEMLEATQRFLEEGLAGKSYPASKISAYATQTSFTVKAFYAREGTIMRQWLDREVVPIWNTLTPDGQKNTRFVVSGPGFERKNNLFVRFFAKLAGRSGEDSHIQYIEHDHPAEIMSQFGSNIIDQGVGTYFLEDAMALRRELMEKPARDAISKIYP